MKFQVSSALALLLAGTALASPAPSKEQTRKAQIMEKLKKLPNNGQVQPFRGSKNTTLSKLDSSASDVYDGNWGGAVTTTTGITSVQATFTVPTVSLPPGDASSGTYYGCAWVGIDGDDSCSQGLWQAGAYWLYSSGSWSYFPFFEWYPGGVNAASMSIAPGDSITVEVVATSTTSGTYYFTNNANGQTASGSLSGQPELCQQTVEWIVEDNNGPTPVMPDFGSVTFTAATYSANGAAAGVSGSDIYIVNDNNADYTNCATSGYSTVSCSWQS